jgi:RND family efflux transporter MFP subunit
MSQRRRHTRLFLSLILFVLVGTGGVWLHFQRLRQADASLPVEHTPWALHIGTVERGSVAGSIESVAVIEAPNPIVLSPQIQGTALAVGPRAGVPVKRGELLVRIDDRTIASNLSALEYQRAAALADLEYATMQQERSDSLRAKGDTSQSQADQARTAADSARAKARSLADQIAALRVQLGYAEIRAPQDAVVAERTVEVGDTVAPGKPVYQLVAGEGTVVRVGLPAAKVTQVRVGDTLVLRQGDVSLKLSVARISPAVDTAGLATVEADAPTVPFDLPSGSTVAATILMGGGRETLTVPAAALVGGGDATRVMVLTPAAKPGEPGILRRVHVQLLQEGGTRAAVRGDLNPGEHVVVGQTAVLARLSDGDAAVTMTSAEAGQ